MQIYFFKTKIVTIQFFSLDVPKTIPILSASVERPWAYLLVGHGVLSVRNSCGN